MGGSCLKAEGNVNVNQWNFTSYQSLVPRYDTTLIYRIARSHQGHVLEICRGSSNWIFRLYTALLFPGWTHEVRTQVTGRHGWSPSNWMTRGTSNAQLPFWNKTTSANRCICVLATEILGKFSGASTRTLGRSEETLLSSGWTLSRSEFSSPNFNSAVRAKRSFAIHYLNLDIRLTTRLTPTFGCGIFFGCFWSQITTESEGGFFGSHFSVTLLRNLADFGNEIHFSRK